MKEHQNKVLFNLADRFFDFTENFDGTERNFNTSNVIWIRWWKKESPTPSQENWKRNKFVYLSEKFDITLGKIAEALTEFGDIVVVKDSWVTAFVEFTSFESEKVKLDSIPENIFENEKMLSIIQSRLEEETIFYSSFNNFIFSVIFTIK